MIATASAGPLRQGFGPVRDHVLGCTVATGDRERLDGLARRPRVRDADRDVLAAEQVPEDAVAVGQRLRVRAVEHEEVREVWRNDAEVGAGVAIPLLVEVDAVAPAKPGLEPVRVPDDHDVGRERNLRRDLFDLARYGVWRGLAMALATNGTLVTREVAQK